MIITKDFLKNNNIQLKFDNNAFKHCEDYGYIYANQRWATPFYKIKSTIYIRENFQKDSRFKTFLLHEIGHCLHKHRIGNLKEEIEADNFSLKYGGNIDILIKAIDHEDKEYYGRYIHEPIYRKLILLLKKVKNEAYK